MERDTFLISLLLTRILYNWIGILFWLNCRPLQLLKLWRIATALLPKEMENLDSQQKICCRAVLLVGMDATADFLLVSDHQSINHESSHLNA